jgi:isoleucyl-tRNA synthetase
MAEPAANATFSFVNMEHDILDYWQVQDVFQQTLENTREKKPYIFYDGPPFATGLPHHGHLLASTIKDIVPRYWTMKGRYVMRRFGWDVHGLPVEHEIDKLLNMSAQQAVEEMGVAGYNDQCRAIVQRYVGEWRHTITRLGRWVDFDNDYKTMDPWYMESLWWVLKQLWDKGLVYQGLRVMPVSTALGTPLSNFEATSNYQDVQDPAVTVLFKLEDEEAYLSAWTTTPWTLPSNLGICVGADIDYVKVRDDDRGLNFYIARECLGSYGELTVLSELKGSELVGRRYRPMFPYFAEEAARGAFVVVADGYVTTEAGTGIVHQAPAFGEDDYRILKEAGIEAFVCPVTPNGIFMDEVSDFAGQYVKDADKEIIKTLRDSGDLYRHDTIQHSYPYCYRSDTPLIYRAIPSWYVRVTEIRDKLINANQRIRWVPDHIKEGRFGNWLEGAIDWSISRNRVWGTPIPIWINDVTGSEICIGSIDELEKYTGVRIDDLHREHVDPLTFELDGEEGTYRRIEEVLDCWFESGSMPYAQLHYPFENEKVFEAGFPAEFIAEGLDQTRGWFYTLTVLAAALYDKPAFRNVIVNGMVMAEDGKKMSKRLKNYTAPDELMETYGADALRLYLINSGLVRGEEQRFTDSGVRDMARRALLPWYNAFYFLKTYAEIDQWSPDKGLHQGENILDQWIISRLQTLKANVAEQMEGYRLYNVVPQLFAFIEDLTNWYIRLNRTRYWGDEITADKIAAYSTLYATLFELSQVMAPFAPFLAEHLYLELSKLGDRTPSPASVHLCDYPESEDELAQPELEVAVDRMQQVVLLGRQRREERKVGLRTPLRCLTIIHRDTDLLADLQGLEETIKSELNVMEVRYDADEEAYIELVAKPNFPLLGKRLGKRMKEFQSTIQSMTAEQIAHLQAEGEIELLEETFSLEEIQVLQKARAGTSTVSNRFISVDLDCTLDDALVRGGYAREIVNRIQQHRKERALQVSDRIVVHYDGDPVLLQAAEEHEQYIVEATLAVDFQLVSDLQGTQADIDGRPFNFRLEKAAPS